MLKIFEFQKIEFLNGNKLKCSQTVAQLFILLVEKLENLITAGVCANSIKYKMNEKNSLQCNQTSILDIILLSLSHITHPHFCSCVENAKQKLYIVQTMSLYFEYTDTQIHADSCPVHNIYNTYLYRSHFTEYADVIYSFLCR